MTVIVYRDGVLAADTGVFVGDVVVTTKAQKARRTPSGWLAGCTGEVGEIEAFHRWCDLDFSDAAKPKPESGSGFTAILVSPDGVVHMVNHKFDKAAVEVEWLACGGATEFAFGALAAGKTARETVELCIRYHSYGTGHVTWVELLSANEDGDEPETEPSGDAPAIETLKERLGLE